MIARLDRFAPLAERYDGFVLDLWGVIHDGVKPYPGAVATRLLADYMGTSRVYGASPERGADTVVYLATAPEVEGRTGKYFTNRRETRSSPASCDEGLARRLWEVSARLTGISSSGPGRVAEPSRAR